jgi:hypothetical protein
VVNVYNKFEKRVRVWTLDYHCLVGPIPGLMRLSVAVLTQHAIPFYENSFSVMFITQSCAF